MRFVVSAVVLFLAAGSAFAAEWPDFRGPAMDGHSAATGLPLTWSETENVRWKTALPLQGWSSPVIQDGRIWMTTATEDGHDFYVLCVEAETGALVINDKLFHSDNPEPLGNNVNSYASPSPVIEPGRVYVHFGSYGTACLDTATGKPVWTRDDLPCRHYRGPGSSPILFENLLILTFDGADLQYVVALDKATGKTVWKTDRSTVWQDLDEQGQPEREGDFRKGFSTPIIVDLNGKPLMISSGSSSAFAYDPRTGKEIWSCRLPGYTPASRPVYGDGLAFIPSGRGDNAVLALRVEGQGDITDTNLVWKAVDPVIPTEPSPLFVDGLLYLLTNNGAFTCFEAATGTQIYSERIGGNYLASPLYADGRIYLFSTQGKGAVVKAGRAFELLATNNLDKGLWASPAVLGKALIVRTKTDLYRIEEPAK